MNKIKILMISSLFFIISFLSFADSTITSTEFGSGAKMFFV